MTITATSLPRPQRPIRVRLATRIPDFFALMKPRVMFLSVFTAFVGMMTAPAAIDPILMLIAILAIAIGAGAAGALNMWYDADIDAVMTRTARRPIPRGRVSRGEALAFGLFLACSAILLLGMASNVVAAGLLAFTIFFYVAVYTLWLKRRTPQNIVIGGAAGALPPIVGWAVATGDVGLEPFILFLIIFLWTPPHFWALSLNRADEYARAGVPMLPVVVGRAATTRQIFIYSALLIPASLLPLALGYAGAIYGVISLASGAIFLALALQLRGSREGDRQTAQRLFLFSISYLFLLFAALLMNSTGDQLFSTVSLRDGARRITRSVPIAAPRFRFRTAIALTVTKSNEA